MKRAAIALSLLAFGVTGFVARDYLRAPIPMLSARTSAEVEHEILHYIAVRQPTVPLADILAFPRILMAEAESLGWDHCLLLAQAEVESGFRSDRRGKHGEVGIFQILPATARHFGVADAWTLQGLAINTQTATAYLRDIQTRKTGLKDVLAEYNGGPKATRPDYYRLVVGAYVQILERESLRCLYSRRERLVTLIHEDRPRRTTP